MNISHTSLILVLLLLIALNAFFSAAEIGMMSLNQYRLRHLVRKKNRSAIRVNKLLERPERLLGVVLIGNTIANIVSSAITTIIAHQLWGDMGVAIATFALTMVILTFGEMAPKTVAAMFPQKVAFAASRPLQWLLYAFSPLVWFINFITKKLLRIFGIKTVKKDKDNLTSDELRSIVYETGSLISSQHKEMLISILDLEKVTVEDIMVPRQDIVGIDLDDSWENILDQLEYSQHTRLPIYKGTIDKVKGMIHLRDILNLLIEDSLTKEQIEELAEPCHFILEGSPLHLQLLNFQKAKQRSGLVVNEYGDIQGLVTLEDILEEIVGEFTTDMASMSKEIYPQEDGSHLVDGGAYIRDLNRVMQWNLPTIGPKTLSGLITEYLGFIPPPHVCVKISGYPMEILQVKDNLIKTVKMIAIQTHP